MGEQKVTVGSYYRPGWPTIRGYDEPIPFLPLVGDCLEKAGFGIGAQVWVEAEPGRLVVRLRNPSSAAAEPIIGHLKADHRMGRNHLKGEAGDQMNAILAGCGYNIRKLLRELYWLVFRWLTGAVGREIGVSSSKMDHLTVPTAWLEFAGLSQVAGA